MEGGGSEGKNLVYVKSCFIKTCFKNIVKCTGLQNLNNMLYIACITLKMFVELITY